MKKVIEAKALKKEIVGVGMGREVAAPAALPPPASDTVLSKATLKSEITGLDAAAKVLGEAGDSLSCPAIATAIFAKGYWSSNGKTPAATLRTAIVAEIEKKGDASRFKKTGRGLFAVRK